MSRYYQHYYQQGLLTEQRDGQDSLASFFDNGDIIQQNKKRKHITNLTLEVSCYVFFYAFNVLWFRVCY